MINTIQENITLSATISDASSEQASGMEESLSTLEDMSYKARQNADNANHADRIVRQSQSDMDRANKSMRNLIRSGTSLMEPRQPTNSASYDLDV